MGLQRVGHNWATFTFTGTKSKIVGKEKEKQWERQKEGKCSFTSGVLYKNNLWKSNKMVRNRLLNDYCNLSPLWRLTFNCGEGNGTPLQYSCLENPTDGGAWWAAVHGVTKTWTRLSDFPFTFHFHALETEMAAHSSVLAWRIPGTGAPGGLPSVGSHRVGHDWSDLAAAAATFNWKWNETTI